MDLYTDVSNCNKIFDLGESTTKSGNKVVRIFSIEKNYIDINESDVPIQSNTVEVIENGITYNVPELAEAKYFNIDIAREMIFPYQRVFLTRLEEHLKADAYFDIEEEISGGEGAIATAATPSAEAPTSTSNTVSTNTATQNTKTTFGYENTCCNSVVQKKPKTCKDAGECTKDINEIYVPRIDATTITFKRRKKDYINEQ